MTPSERHQQLLRFQNDKSVTVLLMTLGTGAVGLNLTIATRIYILEPQWNPSIEKQAIGRAVRLGQDKKVTVVRFIVQESVEQVCIVLSRLIQVHNVFRCSTSRRDNRKSYILHRLRGRTIEKLKRKSRQ